MNPRTHRIRLVVEVNCAEIHVYMLAPEAEVPNRRSLIARPVLTSSYFGLGRHRLCWTHILPVDELAAMLSEMTQACPKMKIRMAGNLTVEDGSRFELWAAEARLVRAGASVSRAASLGPGLEHRRGLKQPSKYGRLTPPLRTQPSLENLSVKFSFSPLTTRENRSDARRVPVFFFTPPSARDLLKVSQVPRTTHQAVVALRSTDFPFHSRPPFVVSFTHV